MRSRGWRSRRAAKRARTKYSFVRRVRICGSIRWRNGELFVSEVLRGEPVGIFKIGDDHFEVRCGPILLGYIKGKNKLLRIRPRRSRRERIPENLSPT